MVVNCKSCWIVRVLCLCAACFIFAQIVIFTYLVNKPIRLRDDLDALNEVAAQSGIVLFLFEPSLLKLLDDGYRLPIGDFEYSASSLSFAIDCSLLGNYSYVYDKVIPALVSKRFQVEIFVDSKKHAEKPGWPVAIFTKVQSATFVIRFLHDHEDNSWWFGSLRSDAAFHEKIARFCVDESSLFLEEGLLSKFRLQAVNLNVYDTSNIWTPKYPAQFIEEYKHSKFLECNYTRAKSFEYLLKQSNSEVNNKAIHFTHKVKKLLSVVKTVFDGMGIPFWISSGTCLGYFRHCGVIPHSKDVDIGVFARDFSEDIITGLEKQNIKLHIWFGEVNDSLELSFIYSKSIKLDVFFFFEEKHIMWNGGTQLRSGKKFKYIFPKFDLCWTIFLELKLRIPCDTEAYIKSNYGPLWHIPVVKWDWKSSPFNVRENGVWPHQKRKFVMRVYN